MLWSKKENDSKSLKQIQAQTRTSSRQFLRKEFLFAQAAIEFQHVIERLRDPKEGCLWNSSQTINTLRKYIIEESYEVASASSRLNGKESWTAFCMELGDLLLQIFLNSHIASNAGHFSISDVFSLACEKIIRRHPHVFDKSHHKVKNNYSLKDIAKLWEETKSQERKLQGDKPKNALLSKIESKKDLPTLDYATFLFHELKGLEASIEKSLESLFLDIEKEAESLKDSLSQNNQNRKILLSKVSNLLFSLTCFFSSLNSNHCTEKESLDFLFRQQIDEYLKKSVLLKDNT